MSIHSIYARVRPRKWAEATLCEARTNETTGGSDAGRFQRDADKYAAYLEAPEGRLRIDLAFANLREFLPTAMSHFRALDVGGGTGAIAVHLAHLGFHVTLLDPSLPMLELAKRAAQKSGVSEMILPKQGDAMQLPELFDQRSFDVILCHNVLEFVDDPLAVMRNAARILRSPLGIVSVLVRSRSGEVLKAALQNGDLPAAEHHLTAEWGEESLYGGKVRLFTAETLKAGLQDSSFTVLAERGVRVISDYLPPGISQNKEYARIFDLERKLGARSEFAAVARYIHCVAQSRFHHEKMLDE